MSATLLTWSYVLSPFKAFPRNRQSLGADIKKVKMGDTRRHYH